MPMNSTVIEGGGGGGSGNVTGAASSTDNAIARFDGAGGKTLQNSTVTIDDSGNVALAASATVDGVDISAAFPASSTDNAIARFDGTTGEALQNSIVAVADADALTTPAVALAADPDTGLSWQGGANTAALVAGGKEVVRANTAVNAVNYVSVTPSATTASVEIAAAGTDSNIGMKLTPKGTGGVLLPDGAVATPALAFAADPDCGMVRSGANDWYLISDGSGTWSLIQLTASGAANAGKSRFYNSDSSGWVEVGNGGNQPLIGFNASGVLTGYGFNGDADTGYVYVGADSTAIQAGGSNVAIFNTSGIVQQSANGAQWVRGRASELLTLSTSGTTTDTAADLLPANSIIEAVVARVTTTITTATDWKLGDATTAGRFTAANSTLTAGTTDVGLVHVDQTGAAGPRQTAAAKVRVTTTGTPGAGAIRITVFYRSFVAPTS